MVSKDRDNTSMQANNKKCDSPIFIHSLWRAGSTYLFSVFRRSNGGFFCYQEPVHEIALYCRDNPQDLLQFDGERLAPLRHPSLGAPYYLELYKVWEHWNELISKPIIYDEYFDNINNENFIRYLEALVTNADGRPVIQECRTGCRIDGIKKALYGIHIYLWRNPLDQWWSYKCADYFDVTSQMLLNTIQHPYAISILKDEIGFADFHDDSIQSELSHFYNNRLSVMDSYSSFYLLWCLGLLEAVKNADLLLNIDRLSDSVQYREDFLNNLSNYGIKDIDLSDANVPQGYYSDAEKAFFNPIEERIHDILLRSGCSRERLERLTALRKADEPLLWSRPSSDISPERLLRDCARARGTVLARETESSVRVSGLSRRLDEQLRVCGFLEGGLEALNAKQKRLTKLFDASCRRMQEILRAPEEGPEPFVVGQACDIDFKEPAAAYYFNEGFHAPEEWGVWNNGRRSKMIIPVDPGGESQVELGVSLVIKVFSGIIRLAPVLRISAGERELGLVLFRPATNCSRTIRFSVVVHQPVCEIVFHMSDCASPASLALGEDSRNLGFGIEKARISVRVPGGIEGEQDTPESVFWGLSDRETFCDRKGGTAP